MNHHHLHFNYWKEDGGAELCEYIAQKCTKKAKEEEKLETYRNTAHPKAKQNCENKIKKYKRLMQLLFKQPICRHIVEVIVPSDFFDICQPLVDYCMNHRHNLHGTVIFCSNKDDVKETINTLTIYKFPYLYVCCRRNPRQNLWSALLENHRYADGRNNCQRVTQFIRQHTNAVLVTERNPYKCLKYRKLLFFFCKKIHVVMYTV